jgi:hypothetical protein
LAPELQVCAEILLKLPLQTPGLAVGWAELEDEDDGGTAEDVVAGREVVVGGGGGAEVVVRRVVAAEEVEDGAAVVGAWPGMHWKYPARCHERRFTQAFGLSTHRGSARSSSIRTGNR